MNGRMAKIGKARVPRLRGTPATRVAGGRRVLEILGGSGALPALGLSLGALLGSLVLPLAPAAGIWPWILAALALGGLLVAGWRLYRRLLYPLTMLETAVERVCQGEAGLILESQGAGVLEGLVGDLRSLNDELVDLYEDMDHRVARQTRRLAQKTASLNILYEVAASINHAEDINRLLLRYLRTLKEMVNGRAASVRLQCPDGRLRLVGCIALDNRLLLEQDMLPVTLCRCGRALTPGDILCDQDARLCARRNGRPMYGPDEVERIEVPLEYRDQRLGVYRVYVDRPGIAGREDILELLTTIGSHLGMAVAKQRSDAEARRLSIIEERNHLAHELHDSLAQTLASLRFQVRMLEETLAGETVGEAAMTELRRIRNGLDEAHTELRELLNSFRAPLDQRGLVPAMDNLVKSFGQETGIHSFFQRDCRQVDLSAREEMQMLRIVQEALANIRKHAQAHTVRVLLRCRAPGTYLLLVEDDGLGFQRCPLDGTPGEHIGLSIMEERARQIGAELRIESEPGEGTRVELVFSPGGSMRGTG